MKDEQLTITKAELYTLSAEIILGTALIAAVTIRVIQEAIAPLYAYAAGFFVAWVMLYPLMRVAARRKGKTEMMGRYLLRGVLGTIVAIGAGALLAYLR